MQDNAFKPAPDGLAQAVSLLLEGGSLPAVPLPDRLPETGIGETDTLRMLAPSVVGAAATLGDETAFAHMDPPTPWVTWATTLWNAALNQNLLHPATSPTAKDIERRVIDWLKPHFGMDGGHMTPGATVANLTALWAARDVAGARRVFVSEHAHLSVWKSAHLLGLRYEGIAVDKHGRLDRHALPSDLSDACLVLTAGTTSAGAIDALTPDTSAAWTHVDAAWGGGLALSDTYASRLEGLSQADSVAISAHKWLFQPKESALVMFRDTTRANTALAFEGGYLATPNVGVLGSHGATAVPLLATLMAWGRQGMAERIDRCMRTAERVHDFLVRQTEAEIYAEPESGVIAWRLDDDARTRRVFEALPEGMASTTTLDGLHWVRHVAANPNTDAEAVTNAIADAIRSTAQ
ncbi:MAG: pyridoxal-dependent decarboxylase [Pseudomonadota bacterium]